jgi:glycosyltransferase involved in cell wall biosynthesis
VITGKNRFVFVACYYNMSKTLPCMLHSIFGQSYTNWKLIITNDVSDEKETLQENAHRALAVLNPKSIVEKFLPLCHSDQIEVITNTQKKWETENVLNMISMCDDDDIICRIDCDDRLIDLDALAILNSVYETENCDAAWTMHRWGYSDRNISGPLQGSNPYTVPWTTSHLKTFRKSLLNGVPYENFLNMNCELVRRCGDQAVYLPVLQLAKKKLFVPRVMYGYHIDEQGGAVYQTDDAKFQKQEADFIRSRGFISTGESWENKLGLAQNVGKKLK